MMWTKRRAQPVWLGVMLLVGLWSAEGIAQSKAKKRIAVLTDGPAPAFPLFLELVKKELGNFGHTAPDLFPKDTAQVGDFTFETARRQLRAALADPKVDVVWAFGPLHSAAAAQRAESGRLKKPVMAPFVLEASSRALKQLDSRTSNLSYIVWTPPLSRDLKALSAIQPLKHVAYVVPRQLREALPSIEATLAAQADALGVRLSFVSGSDPRALVKGLPGDVDAVYVGPDPRRSPQDIEALAAALIERGLPSFSQLGRLEVERGLLMGLGGPENAQRLARAIAVNTDAILQGEPPGTLTYAFQRVENLVINVATAKALGRPLTWTVLSEAEIIGKREAQQAKKISLFEVVNEVRARNLQLRANEEELAADQQSVREAVGALLPALDASLSGTWRDPDAANGISPERSAAWSGNASQVVLNEPALAQVTINKHLRDATRFDNRTAVLDTVQSAAIGYLNVLRAQVTEQIQRDNLKVTQTELAQARLREELGTGSRSEVVRLETQLATNRKNVIDAVASRNVAEIEVRRLLNQATEEPFVPEDVSLESSALMGTGQRLQVYMTGPERFAVLRRFMAQEAVQNSPELRASAARLAAQQRKALSSRLAPFLPKVAVNGGVTHTFATAGAGTTGQTAALFPENPFSWQVGLTASLSLWEGNARYARIQRDKADARAQALDLEARRIAIEANIRSTLHQAGASFAAIRLQQEAAQAANENLALVQQAYARGKKDIITLVDAQNQALTSQLNANTAVYDFLIDLLEVQRAMGRFEFMMSNTAVEDFFQRLQVFASIKEGDRE